MRKIDYDGLLMCRIQGKIFEKSKELVNLSSPIFIKNYMNSFDAYMMDEEVFLETSRYDLQILQDLNKEKPYGTKKYDSEELYWMGYLYRYFAYTYKISSKQIYKYLPAEKLRLLYLPYHTLDVSQAIERIVEADSLTLITKDNISDILERNIEESFKTLD